MGLLMLIVPVSVLFTEAIDVLGKAGLVFCEFYVPPHILEIRFYASLNKAITASQYCAATKWHSTCQEQQLENAMNVHNIKIKNLNQ